MNSTLAILVYLIVLAVGFLAALLLIARKTKPAAFQRLEGDSMSFISFLDKVGSDIKTDFGKILPAVIKAAQIAEPVIDLALPAVGPEYNMVVNAVVATEQGYAALGLTTATTEQKVAAVLSQVSSTLLPKLQAAGLDSATATTVLTNYINAIASILSGPLSGASASAPAAPAAPAPAPAAESVAQAAPGAAVAAAAQNGPGLSTIVPQ